MRARQNNVALQKDVNSGGTCLRREPDVGFLLCPPLSASTQASAYRHDVQPSGTVTGKGLDDVGSYSISGKWEAQTGRLTFSKQYRRGTGPNPRRNRGHSVQYRGEVQQGQLAAGVRGTWSFHIPGRCVESGRFHLWPSESAVMTTPDTRISYSRVNCAPDVTESSRLLPSSGLSVNSPQLNSPQPVPSAPPADMPTYRVVEDNECVVCFDDAVNTALVPCGHIALCTKCAHKLTECPICRASIRSIRTL